MMVFSLYSNYYDSLYADKDYEAECDFIESVFARFSKQSVQSVLDLGCGTGGHAIPLAQRGYQVTGIDRSEEMLHSAKKKAADAGLEIHFILGDIGNINLEIKADAVIAMFAVISYQTSNQALIAAFRTARKALTPGGLFTFDTWFGPAVLAIQPTDRIITIENKEGRIIRIAKPTMDLQKNIVRVDYNVLSIKGHQIEEDVSESHSMRFFFIPEVELLCQMCGLELVHVCPFMELDRQPTEKDWNVSWILRAV